MVAFGEEAKGDGEHAKEAYGRVESVVCAMWEALVNLAF